MLSPSIEYTSPLLPHPHFLLYSYPTTICQHWFHTFCCQRKLPCTREPLDSFPKGWLTSEMPTNDCPLFYILESVTFCTSTFHRPLVSNYVYISKTLLDIDHTIPQAGKGALAFSALSVPQLPSIGTTPHFVSWMLCKMDHTTERKKTNENKF